MPAPTGPNTLAADRLEAALDAIPLVEMAGVQSTNLAKRLIRLRSAVEIAIAQMRQRDRTAC